MNPIPVAVLPEVHGLVLKVLSCPKEDVIKIFTANDFDESLDDGMRAGGSSGIMEKRGKKGMEEFKFKKAA